MLVQIVYEGGQYLIHSKETIWLIIQKIIPKPNPFGGAGDYDKKDQYNVLF
jgi:hypothetical protein